MSATAAPFAPSSKYPNSRPEDLKQSTKVPGWGVQGEEGAGVCPAIGPSVQIAHGDAVGVPTPVDVGVRTGTLAV